MRHIVQAVAACAALFGCPQDSCAETPCGDVNETGSVTSSDALAVLRFAVGQPVALVCAPPSQPLKSGQTAIFGSGSDGDVQAGVSHSFTDNGDGTITDNASGLMWEKKDQAGGIHDIDNSYTWSTGSNLMDGTITTDFLASLNSSAFAGHDDWRIPNIVELQTLVNLAPAGPIEPVTWTEFKSPCEEGCSAKACSCAAPFGHWTSTTHVAATKAWVATFAPFSLIAADKSGLGRVRAVRNAH